MDDDLLNDQEPKGIAWDCNPEADQPMFEPYNLDLNEEDDEGDWQVLALDRWGDREYVGYDNMRY